MTSGVVHKSEVGMSEYGVKPPPTQLSYCQLLLVSGHRGVLPCWNAALWSLPQEHSAKGQALQSQPCAQGLPRPVPATLVCPSNCQVSRLRACAWAVLSARTAYPSSAWQDSCSKATLSPIWSQLRCLWSETHSVGSWAGFCTWAGLCRGTRAGLGKPGEGSSVGVWPLYQISRV